MRLRHALIPLAVTALVLAPVAAADEEISLLDLVGPSLGLLDQSLLNLGDAIAPTPLAPIAAPAIELGRLVVEALRVFAQATVVGASDGDVGSVIGSPERAGVVTEERVVVDGVEVPAYHFIIPGRSVPVGTPTIDRTIVTPPIGVPQYRVATPPVAVDVTVPPLGVPPITVHTPGIAVDTPTITAPPIRVGTPAIGVEPQEASADLSGADLTVRELRGTLHLGPAGSVPYSVGPTTVGQSLLPEEVPRTVAASTPGMDVLPAMVLVDEPARTLVQGQHVGVLDPQEVRVTDGQPLFPGQHVTTVAVPSQTIETPAVAPIPSQRVPVYVPGQHVTTVEVPTQTVDTPGVVVTEEQVVLPAVDQQQELGLGDVGYVGYVGYGFDNDSSLYPYACTAVVGCVPSRYVLKPYVDYADAYVDAVAGVVDGELVVRG